MSELLSDETPLIGGKAVLVENFLDLLDLRKSISGASAYSLNAAHNSEPEQVNVELDRLGFLACVRSR